MSRITYSIYIAVSEKQTAASLDNYVRKGTVAMEVYLDNSATTRCFNEVALLMHKIMCEDYGNPSSLHHKGVEAENYLRYAGETFAKLLKVGEKEIFFTSGGTESDNIALIGAAMAGHRRGNLNG